MKTLQSKKNNLKSNMKHYPHLIFQTFYQNPLLCILSLKEIQIGKQKNWWTSHPNAIKGCVKIRPILNRNMTLCNGKTYFQAAWALNYNHMQNNNMK